MTEQIDEIYTIYTIYTIDAIEGIEGIKDRYNREDVYIIGGGIDEVSHLSCDKWLTIDRSG